MLNSQCLRAIRHQALTCVRSKTLGPHSDASPYTPQSPHLSHVRYSSHGIDTHVLDSILNDVRGKTKLFPHGSTKAYSFSSNPIAKVEMTENEFLTLRKDDSLASIVRAAKFNMDGVQTEDGYYDLRTLESVHWRDLTGLLDSTGPDRQNYRRNGPLILPRHDCIIVAIFHIRAVIFFDHLLLIDMDKPYIKLVADDLTYLLNANKDAAEAAEEDSSACFEFRALEALLRIVVDTYSQRLHMYSPVVAKLLRDISGGQMDATCLQRLLPLKDNLISIERSANELLTLVVSLIRSEPDIRGLFLTGRREYLMSLQTRDSLSTKLQDNILDSGKFRSKQSGEKKWRVSPAAPVPSSRVREMIPISTESLRDCELMLETFERETIQLRAESTGLQKRIEAAEHFRQIVRDSNRHKLLRLQTTTSVGALAVSSGALLTGVFGMNLISNLEMNPVAFPLVASIAVSLPLVTNFLLRKGLFLRKDIGDKERTRDDDTAAMGKRRNSQLQKLWIDLTKLGDVRDALLFVIRNREDQFALNRTDLRELFVEAALKNAPDGLVDLILGVYGDGEHITALQFRRMLSEMPSAKWGRGLGDRVYTPLHDEANSEPINLPAPSFLQRMRNSKKHQAKSDQ